jgi:hypothetical protein
MVCAPRRRGRQRFTTELHQREVSGKPRLDGARSALAFFHVSDDDGLRAAEHAERKQESPPWSHENLVFGSRRSTSRT